MPSSGKPARCLKQTRRGRHSGPTALPRIAVIARCGQISMVRRRLVHSPTLAGRRRPKLVVLLFSMRNAA